jgi:hypothetical protein
VAAKPKSRAEFVLFDVVYDDGSRRSNRRVPADLTTGHDSDVAIRACIEEQDREIAARANTVPARITTIKRSGKK